MKDVNVDELKNKISKLKQTLKDKEQFIESARRMKLETKLLKQVDPADGMQDVLLDYATNQLTYSDEYGWVRETSDGYESLDQFADSLHKTKPGFFKGSPMKSGPDVASRKEAGETSGKRTYTEAEFKNALDNEDDLTDEEFDRLRQALKNGRVI